jgi:uncharacterized cupredoxin-like copper-binding protein
MPFPRAPILMLVACASAVAAGCGGDEPGALEGRTLRLALDEYRILPRDVRVASGRLRIVATNRGRLTHNVKILREDRDDTEAPTREVGGTRSTQPGESASVTFDALRPGHYRLACTIANHDDLGQYGEIVVSG